MPMSFDLAVLARQQRQAEQTGASEPPFYPGDLLPALQSTLASLADVEVRYEAERDYLEEWSGPEEVKQRLIAALQSRWCKDREPIVERLARLREQATVMSRGQRRERARHKGRFSSEHLRGLRPSAA